MTVTNAKAILTALVAEVEETGVPLCITRNGIPAVVLRKVREGEILLRGKKPRQGQKLRKGGNRVARVKGVYRRKGSEMYWLRYADAQGQIIRESSGPLTTKKLSRNWR